MNEAVTMSSNVEVELTDTIIFDYIIVRQTILEM